METAIQEEVFEEMEEYVLNRHNTVAQCIATQLILELCK